MYKTFDGIKTWMWRPGYGVDDLTSDKLELPSDAYIYVPLVRRAIELRTSAIGSVPVIVRDSNGDEVEWPFGDLTDMLTQMEYDLLVWGATYWLKLRNRVRINGLQRLHPATVNIEVVNSVGVRPEYRILQNVSGEQFGPWNSDDVVHIWERNPNADIGPGISPAQTALGDARLLYWLNEFAGRYFEFGAMPITMLSIPGGVSAQERERLEGWFKRATSRLKNAFRVLALNSDIKVETITQPLKDLALPELQEQARRNVALAFGIPQTMFEDAANYATAREHRTSFWSDTIRPRVRLLENAINNQIAQNMGLTVSLDIDALDIFQEDEERRSAALINLVNAGIPEGLAMQILGMELPDGWIYDDATGAPVREYAGNNTANSNDDFAGDLKRWERKSLKRIKAGKSGVANFVSDNIPPSFSAAIIGALESAKTPEDIKMIFRLAKFRNSLDDDEVYP